MIITAYGATFRVFMEADLRRLVSALATLEALGDYLSSSTRWSIVSEASSSVLRSSSSFSWASAAGACLSSSTVLDASSMSVASSPSLRDDIGRPFSGEWLRAVMRQLAESYAPTRYSDTCKSCNAELGGRTGRN